MNSPTQKGSPNIGCLVSRIALPAVVVALVATVVIKLTPSSRHGGDINNDNVAQLFHKLASEQEGLIPSILFFQEHRKEVQDLIQKFMAENVTADKEDDVLIQDLLTALQSKFPIIKEHSRHFSLSLASFYEIALDRDVVRHVAVNFGTTQYLPADDHDGDHQGDGYEDIHMSYQFPPEDEENMKPGEALFRHYEAVQKYLDGYIDDIRSKLESSSQKWEELSEIEFLSALVELFPHDAILRGYIIGDFTIQREIIKDGKGRLKMKIYFSVPYRNDEPHVIEISLQNLLQV